MFYAIHKKWTLACAVRIDIPPDEDESSNSLAAESVGNGNDFETCAWVNYIRGSEEHPRIAMRTARSVGLRPTMPPSRGVALRRKPRSMRSEVPVARVALPKEVYLMFKAAAEARGQKPDQFIAMVLAAATKGDLLEALLDLSKMRVAK